MTATEFLLAMIEEDECNARACAEVFPAPWEMTDRGYEARVVADAPNFMTVTQIDQDQANADWPSEHLEHVARHDPARVLADCAARREVIEHAWAVAEVLDGEFGLGRSRAQMEVDGEEEPRIIRLLTAAYADHPAHRAEWLHDYSLKEEV